MFHGLSRVKSEIRQKQLEWCHCFCPDTEQLFDFHYKLGKMSQNQTHATETYTTRVTPLILKCLENERNGECDETESKTQTTAESPNTTRALVEFPNTTRALVESPNKSSTESPKTTLKCPILTNNKFSHLMVENSE